MKVVYTLMTLPFLFFSCNSVVAQSSASRMEASTESPQSTAKNLNTTWEFGGIAVGTISGRPQLGSILMPDVVKFPDGTYRLYFNQSFGPGKEGIGYAESKDGKTWEYKGVVLRGKTDPSDKFYIFGGPRVVPLPDGKYRMYFRSSPAHQRGIPPKYKTYSAISKDGIHFSIEDGVRINTAPDDPSSPISLAGHGAFFRAKDGRYVAIFSADPVSKRLTDPGDLFIAYSSDGLEWGDLALLYKDLHDPAVIQKDGQYYLFAQPPGGKGGPLMVASSDGIDWPPESAFVRHKFYDQHHVDISNHVGDVGALIAPNGELWILSNWRGRERFSTAIAYFAPSAN